MIFGGRLRRSSPLVILTPLILTWTLSALFIAAPAHAGGQIRDEDVPGVDAYPDPRSVSTRQPKAQTGGGGFEVSWATGGGGFDVSRLARRTLLEPISKAGSAVLTGSGK